jgi:predicted dehydrogenase
MHRMEGEDYGTALLQHPDGMIGTITASTATWPGFPPELNIHTDKGSLTLKNDIITEWNIKDIPNPSVSAKLDIHSGAGSATISQTNGHEAIITDFIDAVKLNLKPAVSGEDARLATEIILNIYGSNIYE